MSCGGASKASLKRIGAGRLGEDRLEQGPALDQRHRAQVVAIVERHVEQEEQHMLGARVVEGVLQGIEVGLSLSTTTSPSSQPGRNFMPSTARTRCGIFELQSSPLRLIMRTPPAPSIRASMR